MDFTWLPAQVLDISIEDARRQPVTIVANGVPVGFFVRQHGDKGLQYLMRYPLDDLRESWSVPDIDQ